MSAVILPPLDLKINKTINLSTLRSPTQRKDATNASLLPAKQLSLLLSLLAIGVYQKAEAQGTQAELVITAQNNFGEVSQLILLDGKLYVLTNGCELQFVRIATEADLAAINALSPLSLPEIGLEVYLISSTQMDGADVSDYCLNSDPVSEFVDQIRQQDDGSIGIAGMLAAGLGLLVGIGGGIGGGSGDSGSSTDLSGLNIKRPEDNQGGEDDEDEPNYAAEAKTNYENNQKYIEIKEGRYDDEDNLDAGLEISATNSNGDAVDNLRISDGGNWFEIRNGKLFVKKDAEFDYEDDDLGTVTVKTSSLSWRVPDDVPGLTLTIIGDGGFQKTVDVVIADQDDFPQSITLNGKTTGEASADNTRISQERQLGTVDVDEGNDMYGEGGTLKLVAKTWPSSANEIRASNLVRFSGDNIKLNAGIAPEDMPEGTYVFEISYEDNSDAEGYGENLVGNPPAPITFTLRVGDINEQPTDVKITTEKDYEFENKADNNAAEIAENADTSLGIKLATVTWTDPDVRQDDKTNVVSVIGGNDYFEIRNKNELFLKDNVELDYETQDSLSVTILIEDDNAELGRPATQNFTLNITNVDEQPTDFLFKNRDSVNPISENKETEIKLSDITLKDEDRESNYRNNEVIIKSVVDHDGNAVDGFEDLFEIRAGGQELWLKTPKDPSEIDFEKLKSYTFTLELVTAGAADGVKPDDITLSVKVEDSFLNADKEQTHSLAKLQRDGVEIQVTDHNQENLEQVFMSLSENTDDNIFELFNDTDSTRILRLTESAKTTLTAGTHTATIELTKITLADGIDLSDQTIESVSDLDRNPIASSYDGAIAVIPVTNQTIYIDVGKHRYIILENQSAFRAITDAELDALIADSDSDDTYAVVARLNKNGTIDQQIQIDEKDIFDEPQIEKQTVTLFVTETTVNSIGSNDEDDVLGNDDNVDSVSYTDAVAQESNNYKFGVKADLTKIDQDKSYTDQLLAAVDISNGWAAGDRLTSVENVTGSSYRDHIIGSDEDNRLFGNAGDDVISAGKGDDWLDGGTGADVIDGGSGDDDNDEDKDTAVYGSYTPIGDGEADDNTKGIVVDLSKQGDFTFDAGTALSTDDVEVTSGTHHYIVLKKDGTFDAVAAEALVGLEPGSYTIVVRLGSTGLAALQERYEGELFFAAPTTNDGGATYTYALNPALDGENLLANGLANKAVVSSDGDILTNIENLIGSAFDDVLTGDDNDNELEGGSGDDRLVGGDGVDRLEGDAGDDTLIGGADEDDLYGGSGTDTASYETSAQAVTVDLSDDRNNEGGDAEGDTMSSIENLIGSNQNDTLTGDRYDNVIEGGGGADTIDGGDGEDTVSYASSTEAVTVDLSDNTKNAGGDAAGVDDENNAISDTLTSIENLIGSNQNDTLTGDEGDNIIAGGAGTDTIDGGDGKDTASYADAAEADAYNVVANKDIGLIADINDITGVYINLNTSDAQTGGATEATGDVLSNIENLVGTAFADVLIGDDDHNVLKGGDGDDMLVGGLGGDELDGGEGNDTASYASATELVHVDLSNGNNNAGGEASFDDDDEDKTYRDKLINIENLIGSEHNDVLTGDHKSNIIEGGAGADEIDGGGDSDTATYIHSSEGVIVDLFASENNKGGDADGDTLENIENLTGSEHDDELTGDLKDNILAGGKGDDKLIGGDGDDTLIGGAGADTLDGGDGDNDVASYNLSADGVTVDLSGSIENAGGDAAGDTLVRIENLIGSKETDNLTGNHKDNKLEGGDGDDTLIGGDGNDTLIGGAGADTLTGGDGEDDMASYEKSTEGVTVDLSGIIENAGGDAEGDTLTTIENLIGSEHDDVLIGDDENNEINGGKGDDTLEGKAGADRLNGGAGVDTASYASSDVSVTIDLSDNSTETGGDAEGDRLSGIENLIGSGQDDELTGDDGKNRLEGGDGDDTLIGGDGNDTLVGGAGVDTLKGEDGDDTLTGGDGNDVLKGGTGNDQLVGNAGADTLSGGRGHDILTGGNDNDILYGDAGVDNLVGGAGNDELYGGADNDVLEGGVGNDNIDGGVGIDTASYASSDTGVAVNLSNDADNANGHAAGDELKSIENLIGSNYADTLTGDGKANRLDGGDGDDTLNGGGGNDTLYGGTGDDTLNGGDGKDALHGGAGNDRLDGDDGDDTLNGGTGNDTLNGGAGDDTLNGGAGDDTLNGGAGDDTLRSGAGEDQMTGGAGVDRFEIELQEDARAADTITDFTIAEDKILIASFDGSKDEVTDYGSLKNFLDAASLKLEADATNTTDLNVVYNSGAPDANDEIVLVLDDFLTDNELGDITVQQFDFI